MYSEGAERPRETEITVGSDGLAEGLMLLRASTLKIIRLQLAMERQDRLVALAAVDDLVALDRRLEHYLDSVPAAGQQLMLRRELDSERAALNGDKLALAAGVVRRPLGSINGAVDTTTAVEKERGGEDWFGISDPEGEAEEPQRRRWWLAILAFLLALAAAAYFVFGADVTAWLNLVPGAFK